MSRSLPARVARWAVTTLLAAAVASILAVLGFRWLPVPTTAFMIGERLAADSGRPLAQRHDWVPWARISRQAAVAVIAAEDQKFLLHDGFDFEQIGKAMSDAERGKRLRGASTISQQVAKNLFLWPSRSYLRKGLEVTFTLLLELCWSKDRILEVYLNVAEFGPGVYGVQAAAQEFFEKDAEDLTPLETSRLVAVLPNPRKWSAKQPGPYVQKRVDWIMVQIGHGPPVPEMEGELPPDIPVEPGLEPAPPSQPGEPTGGTDPQTGEPLPPDEGEPPLMPEEGGAAPQEPAVPPEGEAPAPTETPAEESPAPEASPPPPS
jgi:monofunctional glycosyltransferase